MVGPNGQHFVEDDKRLYNSVAAFTRTSLPRVAALRNVVNYLVENDIQGSIVECGVWRGGSMMAVAHTLQDLGDYNRELWLFDTFEGMTAPTDDDVDWRGVPAADQKCGQVGHSAVSLAEVTKNMHSTNYPPSNIKFVKGDVCQTIPDNLPPQIALLRLDTDWYESTYHEMQHLFPLIVQGGVVLVDDYGHFKGAQKAVDQYVREQQLKLLLNRIDYTARVAVKI